MSAYPMCSQSELYCSVFQPSVATLQIRHLSGEDKYKDYIEVRRRKMHFIFTIESVGQIPPERILQQAIQILRSKSRHVSGLL
jgi:DNA-directed RNA polymerases I and III subunit RPAC1